MKMTDTVELEDEITQLRLYLREAEEDITSLEKQNDELQDRIKYLHDIDPFEGHHRVELRRDMHPTVVAYVEPEQLAGLQTMLADNTSLTYSFVESPR